MIDFAAIKGKQRLPAWEMVTVRMPPGLREEINEAAHDCRTSQNHFCVAAIREAIRQLRESQAEDAIVVRIAE